MPELSISTEKVGFLIAKAREYDAKEEISDPEAGSNGVDDRMVDVLQDNTAEDPVAREISGFVNALSDDERIDLVTLVRLGRGDGTAEDWDDLRKEAARGDNRRTAQYLLGEPLLGDMLAEGLDELGLAYDEGRLTPYS